MWNFTDPGKSINWTMLSNPGLLSWKFFKIKVNARAKLKVLFNSSYFWFSVEVDSFN